MEKYITISWPSWKRIGIELLSIIISTCTFIILFSIYLKHFTVTGKEGLFQVLGIAIFSGWFGARLVHSPYRKNYTKENEKMVDELIDEPGIDLFKDIPTLYRAAKTKENGNPT